jgi:hypothetical protein
VTVNYNLDDLMNSPKLREELSGIGRNGLEQIITSLLDERRDLLAAIMTPKPKALQDVHNARHRDAADAYLNEGDRQMADDYHALHDSFHGAETPPENPETD